MAKNRKRDSKSWIAIYLSMIVVLVANGLSPQLSAQTGAGADAFGGDAARFEQQFFQPRLQQAPRKDI